MSEILKPGEVPYYRMLSLALGIELEGRGMKRRGASCLSIVKKEFNLRGTRERVLKQFQVLIEKTKKGEV